MVVAVRVRPLSVEEQGRGMKSCCNVLKGNVVAIKKEGDPAGYLRSQMGAINDYCFDAAFDQDSTQQDVYEATAKRFIPNVIKGLNVTVFAYGATGAGKTHTMLGNTRADESAAAAEAGIIPQAVFDLFQQIDAKTLSLGESYKVITSFVEIYNEQVYDLLEASGRVLQVRVCVYVWCVCAPSSLSLSLSLSLPFPRTHTNLPPLHSCARTRRRVWCSARVVSKQKWTPPKTS